MIQKVIVGLQVTVGESEVVLVGTLVKLIFDLKDNYFGLYDQVYFSLVVLTFFSFIIWYLLEYFALGFWAFLFLGFFSGIRTK